MLRDAYFRTFHVNILDSYMNRNRYFCAIKKTHPVNIKSYGNLLKRCIENIW